MMAATNTDHNAAAMDLFGVYFQSGEHGLRDALATMDHADLMRVIRVNALDPARDARKTWTAQRLIDLIVQRTAAFQKAARVVDGFLTRG